MEVKGQKGVVQNVQQVCEPCDEAGQHLPAKGYCVECREYFCQSCTDAHRRMKISRSHKLLEGTDLPATPLPPDDDSDKLTDVCSIHQKTKELIKFFCPNHDDVICGDCLATTHDSCKVDFIVDVAKLFKGGQKYKSLREFMVGIEKKLQKAQEIIQDVKTNNTKTKQEAMNDMKKLKEEVIAYFEEKEQELADEMDSVEADDNEVLASKSTELVEVHQKFDVVKKEIDTKEDNPNQLFISATKNKPVVTELDKSVDGLLNACEARRRDYKFRANPVIEGLLKEPKPLGNISFDTGKAPRPVEKQTIVKQVSSGGRVKQAGLFLCADKTVCKKLDVHMKGDFLCCITGMVVLSPEKLAVTDWGNAAVKLVNTRTSKTVSRLKLSDDPRDLTLLTPGQLAVTLYNKMIQMVSVNNDTLTAGRTFRVSGACRGIDYNNGKLAVIYKDTNNVEIMDTNGVVQHVIKPNDTNKIRGADGFVMFSPSGQDVFVTCQDDCVRKLSLSGAVLAAYSSSELRFPCGLAVTSGGELLVCGSKSHSVHVVGEDGEVRTLLTQQDGLNCPYALCLSEDARMLYVSKLVSPHEKVMCFKLQ